MGFWISNFLKILRINESFPLSRKIFDCYYDIRKKKF